MGKTLEALLLESQLITESQLSAAHADAARTRERLPETLIDLGLIDERWFAEWIAQVSGTSIIDPIPEESSAAIQHKITSGIGRELHVIPVRLNRDTLFVAMVNPLDRNTLEVLARTTGLKIRPMTGVRSAIERLVKRFYPDQYSAPHITVPPVTTAFQTVSDGDTFPPASPPKDGEPNFDDPTITNTARGLAVAETRSRPPTAPQEFGTLTAIGRAANESEPGLASLDDDPTNPTTPLVAIERRLDRLASTVAKMQKRLDEIEAIVRQASKR